MIGLDTNVLVRYFTQDDPVQSPKAVEIVERWLTPEEPGFISVVALAETVWVLARGYGLDRSALASIVERLLRADTLVIENEPEVHAAMTALQDETGEFADALIGALCARAGCSRILTFDRGASRLPGFEMP
jgi:predicted nucleic-acid-binding protein